MAIVRKSKKSMGKQATFTDANYQTTNNRLAVVSSAAQPLSFAKIEQISRVDAERNSYIT